MPSGKIFLRLLAALAVGCGAPAGASTAVVPDSFPTIQAAIDSWRDTVLVRAGRYDEDLRVMTGVTLLPYPSGAGNDTVRAGGLSIQKMVWPPLPPSPPQRASLSVRGFRFGGRVQKEPLQELVVTYVTLEACRLDSGAFLDSAAELRSVVVRGCYSRGPLRANAVYATFTDDSVLGGGIYAHAEGSYEIRRNYVHGPAPYGISAYTDDREASIDSNTVVAADVGILAWGERPRAINNRVTDCAGSGILMSSASPDILGNTVLRCGGYGIENPWYGSVVEISGNTVMACERGGIFVRADRPFVTGNVVGRCGGAGIDLEPPDYPPPLGAVSLGSNTSYLNQGPGYLLNTRTGYPAGVGHNIAFGNLGPGLSCGAGINAALSCNDWYGNVGGVVAGTVPGVTDVSAHPLFCNLQEDDVQLSAGSPLLNLGACGLVGALGQGCTQAVDVPVVKPSARTTLVASPNPGRGAIRFSWSGEAEPEWLDVYDVTGARRWRARLGLGADALAWPGTDLQGRVLPAGAYYARLTGRNGSAGTTFVLIK